MRMFWILCLGAARPCTASVYLDFFSISILHSHFGSVVRAHRQTHWLWHWIIAGRPHRESCLPKCDRRHSIFISNFRLCVSIWFFFLFCFFFTDGVVNEWLSRCVSVLRYTQPLFGCWPEQVEVLRKWKLNWTLQCSDCDWQPLSLYAAMRYMNWLSTVSEFTLLIDAFRCSAMKLFMQVTRSLTRHTAWFHHRIMPDWPLISLFLSLCLCPLCVCIYAYLCRSVANNCQVNIILISHQFAWRAHQRINPEIEIKKNNFVDTEPT